MSKSENILDFMREANSRIPETEQLHIAHGAFRRTIDGLREMGFDHDASGAALLAIALEESVNRDGRQRTIAWLHDVAGWLEQSKLPN